MMFEDGLNIQLFPTKMGNNYQLDREKVTIIEILHLGIYWFVIIIVVFKTRSNTAEELFWTV